MYKPKHFTLEELVHPAIIAAIGEVNCWLRLDEGVLRDLDRIRETWGDVIYINGLFNGVLFDSRGLRPPNDPDGGFWSVHKEGKAFDLVPKDGNAKDLYYVIISLIKAGILQSINTLEDRKYTKTWVHVANMNTGLKPLIIKP